MNKQIIIGNLVRDPERGTTPSGVNYARFTVAVRKRYNRDGEPDSDFFRVTAWRGLGDSCAQYLNKGKKVAVIGPSGISVYTGTDGKPRGQIEIQADEVEFLSPRGQQSGSAQDSSFEPVDNEVLPPDWQG